MRRPLRATPGGARAYTTGNRMKYVFSTLALALLCVHAGARADDGKPTASAWPPKIAFAGELVEVVLEIAAEAEFGAVGEADLRRPGSGLGCAVRGMRGCVGGLVRARRMQQAA